jgi:hypothetical protein
MKHFRYFIQGQEGNIFERLEVLAFMAEIFKP